MSSCKILLRHLWFIWREKHPESCSCSRLKSVRFRNYRQYVKAPTNKAARPGNGGAKDSKSVECSEVLRLIDTETRPARRLEEQAFGRRFVMAVKAPSWSIAVLRGLGTLQARSWTRGPSVRAHELFAQPHIRTWSRKSGHFPVIWPHSCYRAAALRGQCC